MAVTRITSDNIFDPGRVQTVVVVNARTTKQQDNTSVGDGVDLARQALSTLLAGGYDQMTLNVGISPHPKIVQGRASGAGGG